jgi:glycerol-3-phosphate dehydrogenase
VKRRPQLAGYFHTLYNRYGVDADGICAEALEIHLAGGANLQSAELRYVCRNEMECTVEDLIDRRAGFLHWGPQQRLERLREGAPFIREELGLTMEEFAAQLRAYRESLARFHSLRDENCQGNILSRRPAA